MERSRIVHEMDSIFHRSEERAGRVPLSIHLNSLEDSYQKSWRRFGRRGLSGQLKGASQGALMGGLRHSLKKSLLIRVSTNCSDQSRAGHVVGKGSTHWYTNPEVI